MVHSSPAIGFACADPTPFDKIAPLDPALMLQIRRSTAERIRLAAGDRQLWEVHVLPALLAWGAMAQGLPRAPRGLWSEPGGLYACGLATGLRALEAVDASVLGRGVGSGPAETLGYEKRMRLAAFLLGLWSGREALVRADVRRIRADVAAHRSVSAPGVAFEPALGSLLDFALDAEAAGDALGFGWRIPNAGDAAAWLQFEAWTQDGRGESAVRAGSASAQDAARLRFPRHAFLHLMPPETDVWFRQTPPVLLAMTRILEDAPDAGGAGLPEEQILDRALAAGRRRAADERARMEARREARRTASPGWAVLFAHAVDALFSAGLVSFNASPPHADEGAAVRCGASKSAEARLPVWRAADGLWLLWPDGVDVVLRAALRDAQIQDLPDDLELIAAVLVEEGVVLPGPAGEAVHPLRLPAAVGRSDGLAQGLLLARPERLEARWRAGGGRVPPRLDLRLRASPLDFAEASAVSDGEAVAKRPTLPADQTGSDAVAEHEAGAADGAPAPSRCVKPAAALRPAGFRFAARLPRSLPGFAKAAFEAAFEELSRSARPHRWACAQGVFLPERLFLPEAADAAFAAAADAGFVLRRRDIEAGDGTDARGLLGYSSAAEPLVAARRRDAQNAGRTDVMFGVVVPHVWVRPMLLWPDGTMSEARWPPPGIEILEPCADAQSTS